ncbi:MAG: hypothetical protein RR364_01720 [Lachnospiraceae bacterium]
MDQDSLKTMTPFDAVLQTQQLQMMKAAIPYLSTESRKALSMFIKCTELFNTMHVMEDEQSMLQICSLDDSEKQPVAMLQELRTYCSGKDQENIDMLINFYQMFETYETLFS